MPSKSKKAKSTQGGLIPRPAVQSTTQSAKSSQTLHDSHSHPEYDHEPQPLPHESEIRAGDTTESAGERGPMPAVNRKKQKRRDKEAAKRLAQQQQQQQLQQEQATSMANGHIASSYYPQENGQQVNALKQGRGPVKGYFTEEPDYVDPDFQNHLMDDEDEFYSNDEDIEYSQGYSQGPDHSWLNTSKRKKSAKKRTRPFGVQQSSSTMQRPFPTLSNAALRSAHKMSNANDHIWNTSTQAERENIKQFWLELGEQERRSLVRVEKEAVLRKMKEQQKHSCSCSVCGRKRTAIEEELEVLYDAYYRELEQFANHDDQLPESPSHMPPPPRTPSAYRSNVNPHPMAGAYPEQGRIHELDDEDDEDDLVDEDDYDDEEEDDDEDDEYSDEYDDDLPPGPADFFQFGNSLTVKDGILTVADDLLKNDGKHFIDMMEQLAERRMQREEEILYPVPPLAHQNSRQGHNHPPTDEDEDYDDEDDEEDYDSQDEEDEYDGDEMDSMTEEQRMEEGRRMFQIFAARMFEQRVLTAYKEKVAAERQKKLLEELDAEEDQSAQREAKKAKDAAKKKEKKARQKAAKDEEKAKRDAEKAAAEAAIKEAEEKKAAEKRAKQEELRKRRETERKAAEDEKLRKEAERVARLAKDRERQQEAEKKARETKEREKKQREEQRKKERQEKEAKEAEAREKRAQEDRVRKEREQQQRKDKEAAARSEREAKDRQKSDSALRPAPVVLPPGLATVARTSQPQAATVQAATPMVVSAVPAHSRGRQVSQPSQHSVSSSPRSQKTSTEVSQTSGSPANVPTGPQALNNNTFASKPRQQPPLHHPQPFAPRSPLNGMGRSDEILTNPAYPKNQPHISQSNSTDLHSFEGAHGHGPGQLSTSAPNRGFTTAPGMANYHHHPHRIPPPTMPHPPGFFGPRPNYPNVPYMPFQQAAPGGQPLVPPAPSSMTGLTSHSRQPSGSETTSALQPLPIGRPGPIARPSSTTPDKQKDLKTDSDAEVNRVATQLGSSALLDDNDAPFVGQVENNPLLQARGPPRSLPYPPFQDKSGPFGANNTKWPLYNANNPMAARFPSQPAGGMLGQGWPAPNTYNHISPGPVVGRPQYPRAIATRLLLIQSCKNAAADKGATTDQWYSASELHRRVLELQTPNDIPVQMDEIMEMCETEGNMQNGGGTFETTMDPARGRLIKWVEDIKVGLGGQRQEPREMGNIQSRPLPPPIAAPTSTSVGSIGQGSQWGMPAYRGPPGRHF